MRFIRFGFSHFWCNVMMIVKGKTFDDSFFTYLTVAPPPIWSISEWHNLPDKDTVTPHITCWAEHAVLKSFRWGPSNCDFTPLQKQLNEMQVFSIWGPLLSTFVGCLQSIQGKHFCFCKLCDVLWFMFSRGYAQFKFLLQGKCCSATVGKLHYVAYLFLYL